MKHFLPNPIEVLRQWEWDGWDQDGWHQTWRSRVGTWCMWKVRIAGAIFRSAFQKTADSYPFWIRVVLRLKAVVCLLLGRHCREGEHLHCATLVEFNWRKVSWEYDEWDCDRVEVGWGLTTFDDRVWRNWRVHVEFHGGM